MSFITRVIKDIIEGELTQIQKKKNIQHDWIQFSYQVPWNKSALLRPQ